MDLRGFNIDKKIQSCFVVYNNDGFLARQYLGGWLLSKDMLRAFVFEEKSLAEKAQGNMNDISNKNFTVMEIKKNSTWM